MLGSSSAFVSSMELFGQLFITDGYRSVVYDPKLDTVVRWVATGAGQVPEGILILSRWNGRALAVRREERQNVYASKLGDAYDWDTFPSVVNPEQAWALNTPGAVGLMPDQINTLIPMNDEALMVGCDSTIHIIQGDPARDFGIHAGTSRSRIVLVSDTTGVSFGTPSAKDPQGNVYFMGSKGGVFVASASGQTVEISEHWIERRLADIDFTTYRIEMAWDYRRNGLVVAQVPYSTFGVSASRWFWEKKVQEAFGSGGWWEDTSSATDVQVTALHNLDTDAPDDRVLLVGCEDGRVRFFDDDAVDDDGHRIVSSVTFGPIVPAATGYQHRFSHAQLTLADNQGGARLQGFVSDVPDEMGQPLYSRPQQPGLNPFILRRARGSAFWLKIVNGAPKERWAFESLTLGVEEAGRKRVRT